jgi:hypothetical protein
MQAPAGQHCVPIPAQLVIKPMTVGPSGATRCAGNYYVQVPLLPTVSTYEAVWWSDIGLGTRWWGGPFTTYPGTVLGIGYRYEVPQGYAAVSAAYGDCGGTPGTFGVSAWGISPRWAVSGTITVSGSSAPAPHITVQGVCQGGGGTTSTDQQGKYEFLVSPGACTVTPRLMNNLNATPVSRSFDVESNVDHVDFQVPCGAVPQEPTSTASTGSDGRRQPDTVLTPAISSAASSAACLQVFIKIVGPIPNVGTRSGLSLEPVPGDSPMNFMRFTTLVGAPHEATPLVAIHQAGQQCVSGCANILIRVVNKVTGQPATDAHVNVQLGAIDTEAAPSLHQQGAQFLCLQTGDPEQQCGTSLDELGLDDQGEIRLLYWSPGELVKAHVELYAQACTPSACALKRAKSTITVYPYRIFHYEGELEPDLVDDLFNFAKYHGYIYVASLAAEHTLQEWVEEAEAEETLEEHAVKVLGAAITLVFLVLDIAHMRSELLEQYALRDAYLQSVGLAEAGLDADPSATTLGPASTATFDTKVLGGAASVYTYPSGVLWDIAKYLVTKYKGGNPTVGSEPVELSLYETSYCKQQSDCGPGYVDRDGIQTDLCFVGDFWGVNGVDCGNPYNAPIWVVSQKVLDRHLKHPDALDISLP